MKTELKAKFLQHLNHKKQDDGGFTLIELLVVIIIIGILSAIALPSFLNQANKAKQSEAKQYAGSMNRSQQAYYLEKNEFSSQIGQLGLGIATQTANYQYVIVPAGTSGAANEARSLKDTLKSYAGGVQIGTIAATSEATTLAVLCESNDVGNNAGNALSGISYGTNEPTCSGTYQLLD